MKLTIEDGDLIGPGGITFGRLMSMDIELIEQPRLLTPTQVRELSECPFCDAAKSEFCRRWRGGTRKANHAERVRSALENLDSDGTVSERSERYGNSAVFDVRTALNVKDKENSYGVEEVGRPTAAQLEREAVARVWQYWLEICGKPRQRLEDKRTRVLRNAIRLVGEETTKQALLGLSRSPWHQGQNPDRRNYMEVRYALKGTGNESDDERIEKAITWGVIHAPGSLPQQMDAAKVERYLDDVRYTLSLPHRPERERGMVAWKRLKEAGFRIAQLDRAPWARLER